MYPLIHAAGSRRISLIFLERITMKNNTKIFSELAELAGGAVGVISSLRQQLRDETRERMDAFANRMDLVTRDDITRLEGMIAKLRTRIEAVETRAPGTTGKPAAPKPAPAKVRKPTRKSPAKTTKKKK